MPDTNKVTVVGPNLRVEREVDELTALRVISLLLGAATEPVPVGALSSPIGISGTSLTELFSRIVPGSNPARIATVAHYLRTVREEPFTRDRVRQGLRDARQKTPGNFARDFDVAVRNGWLDGNDKAGYVLTASGIAAVEARFSDERVPTRPRRTPSRGSKNREEE